MLRDEFNRLMSLFAQSTEGKAINLDELFKESISFFEHLNYQLKNGTYDEKHEALGMMSELYAEMNAQTQRICQKTGMSEEQLATFADNPNNFTAEQWQSVQETKAKMAAAGQDIAKNVKPLPTAPKEGPSRPASPPSSKPSVGRKRSKRSDWLRS
ncbi:MAG: hypothetical protein K2P51_05780 [Rhabdochlamydiaceae bacterium]|nr:hypothetical protein [Rhabdochlamydiaceae bacterium]